MVPPREDRIWKICLVKITTRVAAVHIFQFAMVLMGGDYSPPRRGGVAAPPKNNSRFEKARTGWSVRRNLQALTSRRTDHPVCGASVASRLFITAAASPPLRGGDCAPPYVTVITKSSTSLGGEFADEAWQYLADGHSQQNVGQVVQRSGLRVHDDDARAGRFGGRNRAGYGIHLQARSDREQQFRVCCGPHCAFDDFRNQGLAEGDGGAFQDSSTTLAWRILFAGADAIQYGLHSTAPVAVHTRSLMQGAMHLNHFLRRVTSLLVQAVYVLRDQSVQLSAPLDLHKRAVSRVGPRPPRRMIEAALPRQFADLCIGHVLVDVRQPFRFRILGPDTLRAPEVRDTGLSRNTGARQCDDSPRFVHPPADNVDVLAHELLVTTFGVRQALGRSNQLLAYHRL